MLRLPNRNARLNGTKDIWFHSGSKLTSPLHLASTLEERGTLDLTETILSALKNTIGRLKARYKRPY
jgi:hypothetical protein